VQVREIDIMLNMAISVNTNQIINLFVEAFCCADCSSQLTNDLLTAIFLIFWFCVFIKIISGLIY
jgi:hypothetical protein